MKFALHYTITLCLILFLKSSVSFTHRRTFKPSFRLASKKFEVTVVTDGGEKKVEVGADEYILDALESAGIDQMSSCRAGTR